MHGNHGQGRNLFHFEAQSAVGERLQSPCGHIPPRSLAI
jgi:hypothetical protein